MGDHNVFPAAVTGRRRTAWSPFDVRAAASFAATGGAARRLDVDIASHRPCRGSARPSATGIGFTGIVSNIEYRGSSVKLAATAPASTTSRARRATPISSRRRSRSATRCRSPGTPRTPSSLGQLIVAASRERSDHDNDMTDGHFTAAALLKTGAAAARPSLPARAPSPASRRSGRRTRITLRQFGTGVSNLNAIAEKCKADLGITLRDDGDRLRRRRPARRDPARQLRHRRHRILDLQEGLPGRRASSRWMSRSSNISTRSCRCSSPAS